MRAPQNVHDAAELFTNLCLFPDKKRYLTWNRANFSILYTYKGINALKLDESAL